MNTIGIPRTFALVNFSSINSEECFSNGVGINEQYKPRRNLLIEIDNDDGDGCNPKVNKIGAPIAQND